MSATAAPPPSRRNQIINIGRWSKATAIRVAMMLLGISGLAVLLVSGFGRDIPLAGRLLAAGAVAVAGAAWVALDIVVLGATTGLPVRVAASLCLLAVGGFALFSTGLLATRATLLAAILLLYLGGGELITKWRRRTHIPLVDGIIVALTSVMIGVLGYLSLRPGADRAIWLLVAAAAIAPLAVTLFSESLLRRLVGVDRDWTLWVLSGAGALLLGVVVTAGVATTDTDELVLVGGVLLVLMAVLVVANSPIDLVVALTVLVVLVAITKPPADVPATALLAQDAPTLIALGDSYMSGEGAASFYSGTDRPSTSGDENNQCRRAPTSYAVELVTGTDARFEQLAFVACSGARATEVFEKVQYTGEPAGVSGGQHQLLQLKELQRKYGFQPELVIVSIGGNDSGFSTIGMTCGAPGDCTKIGHYWLGNLPAVGDRVAQAYRAVREQYRNTPVLVVPYVLPMPPDGDCRKIWLTARERAFVNEFARALNATLKERARQQGFYFLDAMQDAMAPRKASADLPARESLLLCDVATRDAGVNFIGVRSVSDAATRQSLNPRNWVHNSLHPNEDGHDRMGQVVREWLDGHPELAAKAPDEAGTIGDPPSDPPDPDCQVIDDPEAGCRALAVTWAKERALEARPWAYAAAASASLGAWLIALTGLARYRRWRT